MIKDKVKTLWELCFDDSQAFIDLYFRLRHKDEITMTIQDGEEVVSALQMIPYPMTFCDKEIRTSYISGACTHPDHRGNGAMRELLSQAFERMTNEGVMLSTLISAEPWLFDYYARLGYVPVFRHSLQQVSDAGTTDEEVVIRKVSDYDPEAYRYLNHKMHERPCCIQHTSDDFKVILADAAVSGGSVYIASVGNSIVGLAVTYLRESGLYINELFSDSPKVKAGLLHHIAFENTTQKGMFFITPPALGAEQSVLGMARIIDALGFLQLYAAYYPEKEMSIELTDKYLSVNNGYYYLNKGKCTHSKQRLSDSPLKLTISELGELLLAPMQPYMSLMLN